MPAATKYFSQKELLLSIQRGDKAAFGLLFDTYSPVLFTVINKTCADHRVSEAILQQAFVEIWQNITRFDPSKQRFLAWMLIITRNAANMAMEEQKLNKNFEIQIPSNYVSDNNHVLALIYFKGYSLKKAAETLNISIAELKLKLKTELDQIRASKAK